MNFRDLLANDMRSISLEMGTDCLLKGRKVSVPVRAVISDEQSANGGYALLDGRTVSATAQFDAGQHVGDICVGDFLVVGRTTYRVSNITRTSGDTTVTVSLSVEGKR